MASSEVTARIIAEGPEHEVNGVVIRVHPFHRSSTCEASDSQSFQDESRSGSNRGNNLASLPNGVTYNMGACGGQGQLAADDYVEGPASSSAMFPDGLVALRDFLYVSERDLQDAMPAHYDD